jgi:hypothetical protein
MKNKINKRGNLEVERNGKKKIKIVQETFSQLIQRLSELDGLYWMDAETCPDRYTAILELREHMSCLRDVHEYEWAENAEIAMKEIDKFYDTKGWQPTEQDYLECCGVWVLKGNANIIKVTTLSMTAFHSRSEFDEIFDEIWEKIEPMPKQCIPKEEPPKESYRIKYPLLAGVIE